VRELARPVAVAILRRDDRILVFRVPDPVKHVIGYRPAGGTIEFGEAGADTVVREIREELGVEVIEPRYLGTLENIFTYLGKTGHELVRVYEVRFAVARRTVRARDGSHVGLWTPTPRGQSRADDTPAVGWARVRVIALRGLNHCAMGDAIDQGAVIHRATQAPTTIPEFFEMEERSGDAGAVAATTELKLNF